MKRFFSILFATLIALHAHADLEWISPLSTDHPNVGKVYDLRTQEAVEPQSLLAALKNHDVILIGEKHDNPDHHRLEQIILGTLINASDKPSVILEMLDESQSNATTIIQASDSDDELKKTLNWNEKGWPWEYYGPIVRQILSEDATLLVGNISRSKVRSIYKDGTEALITDSRFKTVLEMSNTIRSSLLDEIYEQHCEMMPRERLSPMVNIQLARDAYMAAAIDGVKSSQTILIAGGYHVRKDTAVPLHLRLRKSNKHPLVIMLQEVDPTLQNNQDTLREMQRQADYVWFTPRFTDRDYCKDLKTSQK
ncbi:ChaN family lipoprotein [Pontibacterium sp. N1Y112]|uniref:ChaN family lipoprotein n=1 Tax=Pontibacterium sinense TaxID=2781979 RepID=A0A8J7K0N5_9GAMM|nr:ChaN family lipoprotein [Pontibacterium sinense]MBE9399389.1 ChaN family lipoprotein [Pontibacterium sinense]